MSGYPLEACYGRLTILYREGKYVFASCSCGSPPKHYWVSALKSGNTKSCGCLMRELQSANGKKNGRHRMAGTSIYATWAAMIGRCTNTKNRQYHRYGGRGITVCDRWRTSFENFFEDMGDRPTSAHTLDRRENDGNYEPSNCRWATKLEQTRNRSTSLNVTVGTTTMPLKDWCDKYGMDYSTAHSRLFISKWPVEFALFAPKQMRLSQWKKVACVLGDFPKYMPTIKE